MRAVPCRLAVAAFGLAFACGVQAEGSPIGFVNIDQVFMESRLGQQSKSDLDREAEGYNRELEQLNERGRGMREDLDKNSLILSERDRAERERRINDLRAQYERRQQDYAEQFDQRRKELVQDMLKRIEQAVAKIAAEDNLELVVGRAVVAAPAIDITSRVIRALDATPQR